ncbi:MAG TPA: Fic family protein [Solirubrobacterales bacterium]|nr:Fic family protein [Solirubrobacterales bacterium]
MPVERPADRPNRFARSLEDLDPEERQLVVPAIEAARSSFSGFKEKPHADYHRAPGLSAEETWTRVAEELGRVSALAALEGYRDLPLSADDVDLLHRGIFEPVFGPEKTLGFRCQRSEEVTFPIVLGTQESPHVGIKRGSGGKKVERNLSRALAAFERDVAALAASERPPMEDAARAAVRLYAKVIGIHPFFDGNGRTAWAIVSHALQRCSLVEIAVAPSDATRWALGCALRPGGSQSYEPLTDLVVDAIRRSA